MPDDEKPQRLKRRALVLKVVAVGATAPALAGCVVVPGPSAGPSYAPRPVRTGLTDADPSDGPGQGRGSYSGNRVRTGYTDADPGDGPGYGRGVRSNRVRTGYTDADPGDGPGYGRGGGGYRRSVTDSDPRDAPGRGRG
ncbi:hypothetical protein J5Y09_17295 [Roseomonas sp. PWR1]|uniref:Translation initiation factor IF-2 n=1 Tax=Roseomonas nitratireducens TaxID=2820810 RepID=A0ABS4AY67_9PROT|nr:hypothetical protein [Neoroseomonas nitratireducens]MBP0465686.1 hypothetical protein [Neoroseomonas nitratireducens]